MSRTYRRQDPNLIRQHCGTLEEARLDPWWLSYRYPDLTIEQAYARRVARYTRDNKSGAYSQPSWYISMAVHRRRRRRDTQVIRRQMSRTDWDDFIAPHPKHEFFLCWW